MTYKQIETSREIRLWLGQILTPTAIVVAGLVANPKSREMIAEKIEIIKSKFKKK